jgi:hypothetical protein
MTDIIRMSRAHPRPEKKRGPSEDYALSQSSVSESGHGGARIQSRARRLFERKCDLTHTDRSKKSYLLRPKPP